MATYDDLLSSAGQELLERIRTRREALAREMAERILVQVDDYSDADLSNLTSAVEAACRDHIDSFVHYVATGELPSISPGSALADPVPDRIERGIRLDSYLHAFRVGHDVFWETVLSETADPRTALEFARPSMRYIDSVSTRMAELYLRAQQTLESNDERASRDLLEALLAGAQLDSQQAARVAKLGIDGRALVGVLRGPLESFGANEHSLRVTVETAARHVGAGALVVPRHGALVAVIGLTDRPANVVAAALRSELDPDARCGLGGEAEDLSELDRAHEQALAALRRTRPDRPIVALSEMGAYEALVYTAGPLIERSIAPALLAAIDARSAKGARQAETARAWLESDLSVRGACERLFVHPNTLRYRLRQLEGQAGIDLRHFADLVELRLALDLPDDRA